MTDSKASPSAPAQEAPSPPPPAEQIVSTEHSLKVGDRQLDFTATCGLFDLHEEAAKDGLREARKARAQVFFTAYVLKGNEGGKPPAAERPITFAFNGGPGSSSVWLHLGLLGPKRVRLDDDGRAPPPPYGLVDNEHTLLTDSDLGPVNTTGRGRAGPPKGANQGAARCPHSRAGKRCNAEWPLRRACPSG